VWIIAGYITVDEDEAWRPQAHAPETGITLHEVDVTAYEVARAVYGERFTDELASWQMTLTTAWLTHLERLGEAGKTVDAVEHWSAAS